MGDFVMSFDVFDSLLIFIAGFCFRSFIYDGCETNSIYLKDGMNKDFYLSLINECLDVTIALSCLLEFESDLFGSGLVVFPIMFSVEYISFKFIVPFVKKLLKKGRTKDADSI